MKLRDTNLQVNEKNSFTYPPSCILPSFSENAPWLLFPKRLWKCGTTISFRKYKWKVVCYLFNYDSSKSTFFVLNMAFDVLLSTVFSFLAMQRFLFALYFDMYFFPQNLIVLHHADNTFLFYFDICMKFTLSTIISTKKKW